ncbi:MAG: IS4 family transposase [Opitutales bacterium]
MVGLNGLIDLSHGGLCEFAKSSMQTGEIHNHDSLEGHLREDDVLIADRLYGGYEFIARLRTKGVHFIGRTHQARKIDFRKGRKIGANERLVTWTKPRQRPSGSRLSDAQWEALDEEMQVRIIRCTGPDREGKRKTRYLVTTLLGVHLYPADEVASLYFHRWEIEVRFRDLKSTLAMDMLRTNSPEMIEKEVLMHQIVYNLLRLVMLKAGMVQGVNHRRVSFRGTQQVIHAWRERFHDLAFRPLLCARQRTHMWTRIAERFVTERSGRNEPRRAKRRPKCTRWLQKPRHQYFEHFRSENPPVKILDSVA